MIEAIDSRKNLFIYSGLFIVLILIILVGNALFLIERTSSNLIEIYWKQGELVVESIAVSAQQSIDSIQLTEHQVQRSIRKIVHQIDHLEATEKDLSLEMLQEVIDEQNLEAIKIVENGSVLVQSSFSNLTGFIEGESLEITSSTLYPKIDLDTQKPPFRFEHHQPVFYTPLTNKTLNFPRKKGKGKIYITIGADKLNEIKIQVGLQLFIASLENRNIIKYISFLDDQLRIVGDSEPSNIDKVEEKQEYLDAIESKASYFFLNDDVMEVIQPISFTKSKRGIFKISFPTTEIDRIYQATVNNTILFSSWFMLIVAVAVALIMRWQLKNIQKLSDMKWQIREKEKLISLSTLAAGVAHEVRNPLNSISITIQRLQWEFEPKSEVSEYQTLTQLMKKEVDRINGIITDFLSFSKPFDPKKNLFDINLLINETYQLFREEAETKGVKTKVILKEIKKEFYGDQEKIKQVMLNLLRNALEVSQKNAIIEITSEMEKNGSWKFIVEDQGEKVSKATLNRAFDIYFTTKQNGTGLGLYISNKIIMAHEGEIKLVPNSTKGITASFTLPRADI